MSTVPVTVVETKSVTLGPWTIVELKGDNGLKGFGASKKSKLDRWDEKLGLGIAKGRAMKDLLNKTNKTSKRSRNIFIG